MSRHVDNKKEYTRFSSEIFQKTIVIGIFADYTNDCVKEDATTDGEGSDFARAAADWCVVTSGAGA